MFRMPHSFAAVALLLVIVATCGAQRAARANDTGALIGGLIAGAIVYELLDDDDDYCRTYRYYGPPPYYRPPVYYPSYPRYYRPSGGVTIWYEGRAPSCGTYTYREHRPRYGQDQYWRAPSHGQRKVGPPAAYRRPGKKAGGGRYHPPRRYGK